MTPLKTFVIQNINGLQVKLTNYGAAIMEILVPIPGEGLRDIVLGFAEPEEYQKEHPFFGATIGRYANRIAHGRFILEGRSYQLDQNFGDHHLHGGSKGFDKQIWEVISYNKDAITLYHQSPDGFGGFPGNLNVEVTYRLTDDNHLIITYQANVDAHPTIINLTNHIYFNLNGAGQGKVLDHALQINADFICPVDSGMIPQEEFMSVSNTPFDFRSPLRFGDGIVGHHPQLQLAKGYDHNFIVNDYTGSLQKIATVKSGDHSVTMKVHSTEPGVQLFVPSSMNILGKGRKQYGDYSAFCLETQHFPDSPNRPDYPSTVLYPNEEFRSQTIFKFAINEA